MLTANVLTASLLIQVSTGARTIECSRKSCHLFSRTSNKKSKRSHHKTTKNWPLPVLEQRCTMKILVYSTDQVLWRGLELAGMERRKFDRQKRQTNLEDFRGVYGTHPMVLAVLWEKLHCCEPASSASLLTFSRAQPC